MWVWGVFASFGSVGWVVWWSGGLSGVLVGARVVGRVCLFVGVRGCEMVSVRWCSRVRAGYRWCVLVREC